MMYGTVSRASSSCFLDIADVDGAEGDDDDDDDELDRNRCDDDDEASADMVGGWGS